MTHGAEDQHRGKSHRSEVKKIMEKREAIGKRWKKSGETETENLNTKISMDL